jgi:hypothetical protein
MINLPTTLNGGERVVALFPIIGGSECECIAAMCVTVANVDHLGQTTSHTSFNVYNWEPNRLTRSDQSYNTLPAAVRFARQQAGWG